MKLHELREGHKRIFPIVGKNVKREVPLNGARQRGGRWATIPDMGNNLKSLREERKWTHDRAAEEMGVSRGQFIKLERGERRLTVDYIRAAARAFGVTDVEVFAENLDEKTVQLAGLVGAGSDEVFFSEGQGPLDMVPAPEGSNDKTVAVEIRGASLGEAFDGWLIFYDDVRTPPTEDIIGKLCVVGLPDGRVVVKKVRRGQLPKRFNLLANVGAPIYDVQIEWAAEVKQMTPR